MIGEWLGRFGIFAPKFGPTLVKKELKLSEMI